MTPRASVIIPALNARSTIARQLEALGDQVESTGCEVVVVDNGSTDGTADFVKSLAETRPWLRMIQATELASPGYARNAGVSATATPELLFCDADDVVCFDWISHMLEALRTHQLCTGSLDHEALNDASLARSRGAGSDEAPTFYGLFPLLAAGNFGVRREAWDRIGGFDASFAACEDAELAFRAARCGIGIGYQPRASVKYQFQTEPRQLFRQGMRYGKGRVRVAALMRDAGCTPPSRVAGLKSWAWLLLHLFDVFDQNHRPAFAWVAGNRIGHAVGSFTYRHLLL